MCGFSTFIYFSNSVFFFQEEEVPLLHFEMLMRVLKPPFCGGDHLAFRSSYYPLLVILNFHSLWSDQFWLKLLKNIKVYLTYRNLRLLTSLTSMITYKVFLENYTGLPTFIRDNETQIKLEIEWLNDKVRSLFT